MSIFFFPPLSYLPVLALLSLFFLLRWSDFKVFRSHETTEHIAVLVQGLNMVFKNSDILTQNARNDQEMA